ncbi:hypothetical protein GGS24DRAFT_515210 [Hypoxylon argillaceum]|nr:hypothetical protein GGS24DRAFT_515210 [Hypoxylon argillaceum]
MSKNIDDVTRSFEGLVVSNAESQDQAPPRQISCRQTPLRQTPFRQTALQDLSRTLIQFAEMTLLHEKPVSSALDDIGATGSINITEISYLLETATRLEDVVGTFTNTADKIIEAAVHSVIEHLQKLGASHITPDSQAHRLLIQLDVEIKKIVRNVLRGSNNSEPILWKIAEECYNQAVRKSGALHVDNYIDTHKEANQEHHEHEGRLYINEDYAELWRMYRPDGDAREKGSWVGFWVEVLRRSPGGPTLFYPPESCTSIPSGDKFVDAPPYLFRVFDQRSAGKSNNDVIASQMSISEELREQSRIDMLSLDARLATERFHSHIHAEKLFDRRDDSENLMSWTSSLLFALQYAIFRSSSKISNVTTRDVQICAVETKRFPPGQFVSDMWLLPIYHQTAQEIGGETESFLKFRYNNEEYYNGEYFSQGLVDHSGRSCVVSLEALIHSGLYDLYPQLNDRYGKYKWSKRVLELREVWDKQQRTMRQEMEQAVSIAKTFSEPAELDIALILLTFKNRQYNSMISGGELFAIFNRFH